MKIVKREARLLAVKVLLQKGYEWLACDADGMLVAYEVKPFKMTEDDWWNHDSEEPKFLTLDNDHDINFVKWEDEEPVNIREWLEKEEEEMKMYSVKGGELECREVDATNGIVALGVNDVVELDRDNRIVTGGATVFKIDARNSGRSAILEKAKTLGGLLKNTNTESMNSQEKQLYCAGEKVNIGDQIFVAKENEVFTVTDIMTDGTVVTTPNINGCARYFRPELIRLLNASGTGDAIRDKTTTLGGLLAPNEVDMASCSDLTYNMMGNDAKDYDEKDWYKSNNVQIHGKICQELTETYEKKNSDYGNSFENSLDKHGMIAGIVRMDDKMSRLISLNSKNEQQVMDESLRDTLMDLANYAIMSVMWLDEQ